MKEITRIHIAKVAYDIEVDAKKEIKNYIEALEKYASDPEILDDIEIRITELLAEHGVSAGGVITLSDIAAVRSQLGEPSDFAEPGMEDNLVAESEITDEPRRVYRDEDEAVLGGVLAGLAKRFGVDPLWVRLLFVIFLFASFGTGLVVYFILWIIVPPAKTAAEKLRMRGEPVTLASIKELVGREDQKKVKKDRSETSRKVLGGIGGSLLILMAIAGLIAVVAVVAGVQFGFGNDYSPVAEWRLNESWWFVAMIGLFAISGLLFSALCFLLASAAFRRQWSKRIGTAVVAIIASGLVVFSSGVVAGMYGYFEDQARLADLRQTSYVNLPANFSAIKTLQVTSDDAGGVGYIEYIVSDQPRYQLESLPGVRPHFQIADDSLSATVKLVRASDEVLRPWDYRVTPVLKIYGPALDKIKVDSNGEGVYYYNDQAQDSIEATVLESSSFELSGSYKKVKISNQLYSTVILDDASVTSLQIDSKGGSVTAGVVRTLSIKQADVCPSRGNNSLIEVEGVSSEKLVYNGNEQSAESIFSNCGEVVIDNEQYMGEEWQ